MEQSISMKKPDITLKEYCQRLSDDNLKFVVQRLSQKLGGDLGDAVEFLSNIKEIDRWLANAGSSSELFDMLDQILFVAQKEYEKRSLAAV